MSFPDKIERSIELAHEPERVWEALTTAEGLSAWFGTDAAIEPRPGGAGRMSFASGLSVELRIERVEVLRTLAYTWRVLGLPEVDPRRTHVEFTLEPIAAGTRLTVVESGFAQLPDASRQETYDSHDEGWAHELGDLVVYLDAS
jgi:uncharacterized protein YndB with AHSA1/START domain